MILIFPTKSIFHFFFFSINLISSLFGGFQDGSIHIYDLQTGQWVSSFKAALGIWYSILPGRGKFILNYDSYLFLTCFCVCDSSDTVNGFSFHPFLPMAASSSGHRRFVVPDDESNKDLPLGGNFTNLNSTNLILFLFHSNYSIDLVLVYFS